MILDAAWAPSKTPMFATAGRDKQVRIWTLQNNPEGNPGFTQTTSIPTSVPVTSVDFLGKAIGDRYALALGTETGRIGLYVVAEDGSQTVEVPLDPE
jgi:elongator complex protein 2